MLEVAVGLVAGLLVAIGILVMIGPDLLRTLRRSVSPRPSIRPRRRALAPTPAAGADEEPDLNPTTRRALEACSRLSQVLRLGGREREAAALRAAARRLRVDEATGIYALQEVMRGLRRVVLPDSELHARFVDLLEAVRREVSDRAEQLELLPRR